MATLAVCVTFTCLVVAGITVLVFAFAGNHSSNGHHNNDSSDSSSDVEPATTVPSATTQTLGGVGNFALDFLDAPNGGQTRKQHRSTKPATTAAGAKKKAKAKQ